MMEPIYLIVGQSSVKNNEKLNEMLGTINEEYDLQIHDLEDESLALLLEDLNMIPFLTATKVVVVKNPIFLYKPSSYDSKLIDAFNKYINNPIPSTTLIIMIESLSEIDSKLKKLLEENSSIINVSLPKETEIKPYVTSYLTKKGYKYDETAVDELIFRIKGNFERADVELEKLMTYKYEDKIIKFTDVRLLVSKDLDDNIFDLVSAVIDGNKRKSMEIYDDLMVLNEDESRIISLLINKFNEMYQTKALVEKGYSKNDIANLFNYKPGRVYYMMKSASLVSMDKIKRNINDLIDIDYKIKSGQIDKTIALETYLLK